MKSSIFIIFSILIAFLTRSVWLELSPWYYKILFLFVIVLIPFILYSFAAKIAFKAGRFWGIFAMISITIIDNYLTNALSMLIISKCLNGIFDFCGFKISFELLKLPWYTYTISGIMGLVSGIIGDKKRQREEEKRQRTLWLGLYLLGGQFLGMAVPEMAPIINRFTPVVETVMLTETSSKAGSLVTVESNRITRKEIFTQASKKTNEIKKSLVIEALDPSRPYNRNAISKQFLKVKKIMHAEGLKRGRIENIDRAVFTDGYTGKRLVGGENFEYDHIRSAESMFSKYKPEFSDEEIAQIVNCQENITTTSTKINRAKGNRSLESLINSKKSESLGINKDLALKLIKKADEAMENKAQEIRLNRK